MTLDSKFHLPFTEAATLAFSSYCEKLFHHSSLSESEKGRALRVILDPFWRPLCELEVNGSTSFEGALILLGAKLVKEDAFMVRTGPAVGHSVEVIDLTEAGVQLFSDYARIVKNSDWQPDLIDSLRSYSAIDTGAGIVSSRSLTEAAIENDDWVMLNRMRSISNGQFMLQSFGGGLELLEDERMEYLENSIDWGEKRLGAQFIRLSKCN
ncbi:MAG: hypothetical protein CL583_17745 [Alteromonadaceae bacterium]|nr:hypothetical protein [Alteromonadaceae bacterium]